MQKTRFKVLLTAAMNLSKEEKKLLWLKLFSKDALNEMKAFEAQLKKKKMFLKKTDEEIVALTNCIRNRSM